MPRSKSRINRDLQERRLAIVQRYRQERGCERCGEDHPGVLDLHHRDPETKHPRLVRKANGKLKSQNGWRDLSYADIATELEKCEVLCANCHRKEEWHKRQQAKSQLVLDEFLGVQ